jgi:GNAT superfamily N-acetyltransferase/SAM-dependent methyltransferase
VAVPGTEAAIRLGTTSDVNAVADFARVVIPATYESLVGGAHAEEMLRECWGAALRDSLTRGLVFVTEANDRIVGLAERGTHGGEPVVWKLYVDAEHRGEGIGSRLLQLTAAEVPARSARLLIEHIAANVDAGAYCERRGFAVIGREPHSDPRLETVWRARPLDDDEYGQMAEFHEVLMETSWARVVPHLVAEFGHLAANAVIADIGAGSGIGTVELARVTDAAIEALEPGRTMRSMLVARLAAGELLDRVTVHARRVPQGLDDLPTSLAGVVASHMLGHLSPDERRVLLEWVARCVAPGGSAVFTVAADRTSDPAASPEAVEERRVGRHVYRATHRGAEPDTYETTFEVLCDGEVVRSLVARGCWRTVRTAEIRPLFEAAGFEVVEPEPGIAVVRVPGAPAHASDSVPAHGTVSASKARPTS